MSFYRRQADIIIRNGTIVDGTGGLPYFADIAVRGDRIDYIGDLRGVRAKLDIDAHHRYVTPGFIDSHAHSDFTMWALPEMPNAIAQGITTEIEGNCGFTRKHFLEGIVQDAGAASVRTVYDITNGSYPAGSMAAVLDKAEALRPAVNTAWLCGHNALRDLAGIDTVDYTPEQFCVMERFLREAMEAGFIGLSTGLEFVPGILSRPEEVERLAAVAAEYDANYSTHMRDEGTYILEAVNEFLNVIRKTGMRGTVSHLNVKYDNGVPNEYLQRAMQLLKNAREVEHLNVLCDMLPTCFATGDAFAILPPWLYQDGWEAAKRILADEAGRARVKADCSRYWRFLAAGQWDRLLYVQPPYNAGVCRTPFAELVKQSGKEPMDCFLDILAEAPTLDDATNVFMQGTVFHEQTMIDSVIRDPIYMWMTDASSAPEQGPLAARTANVQHYMSMTYFFTHYIRDLGVLPIEAAVRKVTAMPAQHYRLEGRGELRVGAYADINVFDLNALTIHATFQEPCRFCTGMDYVLVNGVPAIAGGQHTGARTGRVLRHLPVR